MLPEEHWISEFCREREMSDTDDKLAETKERRAQNNCLVHKDGLCPMANGPGALGLMGASERLLLRLTEA